MLNRNRLPEFNFRERFDRVLPPDDELTYDIWLEMMGGIAPGAGGYSERYHMEVHGPHSVNGPSAPRPVESAGIERVENDRSPLEIPTDEVSISPAARMLEQLVNDPEIRAEKISQIRTAIDAGEYETPEKLRIALDRLLASINPSQS
jgi:anti-sigma28 factor (negative regulator of flagellin synthesis)